MMTKEIVVLDLLKKLSKDHLELTWKINCVYVNGRGEAVYEIIVYQLPNQDTVGRITFNMTTGQVINCYYQGMGKVKETSIVDVLLDVILLEQHNHEAPEPVAV